MSANKRKPILLIGLGRFGGAVARTLERMGHEVLAVDCDGDLVQEFAPDLTKVVQADATDEAVLERLGARDFDAAVVGIGTDIEASVLTVLALADLGLTNIWAKATNDKHARILERTGATHVVFPEQRMGERTAHLINERLLDFISFGNEFAIARLAAPEPIVGLPLITSECRKKYEVTVVGVKREGEDFIHAVPDTIIFPGDELVVSGRISNIEKFSGI
ncbi:potassium channel family protein [Alteriqipengyuania lutimaris]|uniref:TrkA family potassium uptake protein n=1 Tax=Alteriqipengyuania lutimaris TaxID=1538146 RepID=A0A395LLV3_9SPHN|nr:TrkA family potassium uptake protein [Alteriqipengyuania lutimaris]MBB3033638.1 trk system potassium uptake protein TrkA [Alteriqipengyuania lutimaris]RDS77367.1 TrkA family potassium uptake protein [Alteriqipengyuania lutimaris]